MPEKLSLIRCMVNEYSDKLVNQMVDLYKGQTNDDENIIRSNINRFKQLLDSTAKKIAEKNPLVLRVVPPELQVGNRFRDITQYKNYETIVKIVQAVETKKLDPYKQAIEYYKQADKYQDPVIIGSYVARFKMSLPRLIQGVEQKNPNIIRLIPKELQKDERYKNILNWRSFHGLELLIDGAFADTSDEKVELNSAETDADLVYKNDADGIEIYKGDNIPNCVKYGKNQYYSWCISRKNGSMYGNYRFMQSKGDNRMFYFVFDRTKSDNKSGGSFTDEYHAVVIHALENGNYRRTTASNNGDEPYGGCKWDQFGQAFKGQKGQELWNKIKGLHKYFPFKEPSPDERRQQGHRGQRINLDQFLALPLEDKQAWLRVNAADNNLVTSDIVKSLPSNGELSKNDLINHGRIFNYDELKSDPKLAKRYAIYRWTRHRDEPIPYPLIHFLDEKAQEEYYEKYEENYLTYEIITQYFSDKIIEKYIDTQLAALSYLPKEAVNKMNPKQKQLFALYSLFLKNIVITTKAFNPELIPEAVEQNAKLIKIDYKTYVGLNPVDKNKFLKMLKETPPKEKYAVFIWGCPISFIFNDKMYMILPESNDIDASCVLIDENGKKFKDKINLGEITFTKNGKEVSFAPDTQFPIGAHSIYLQQNEYDTIELGYDKGKSEKLDLNKLKSILNEEDEYFKNKLKYAAGIIK